MSNIPLITLALGLHFLHVTSNPIPLPELFSHHINISNSGPNELTRRGVWRDPQGNRRFSNISIVGIILGSLLAFICCLSFIFCVWFDIDRILENTKTLYPKLKKEQRMRREAARRAKDEFSGDWGGKDEKIPVTELIWVSLEHPDTSLLVILAGEENEKDIT